MVRFRTRRCRITVVALLILVFGVSLVTAQQVSERRDIAVFSLSDSGWRLPPGSLTLIDEAVSKVFIDLGRFNVLGMDYRLEAAGVEAFVAKIREVKEQQVELPETVRLGQAAFTEADFNRLVGSFLVVIPRVSYFESKRTDSGGFTAELKTSFTFVNVEQSEATAFFDLETSGSGDTAQESIRDAAGDIASKLQFELRSIPEFQLKTGIIEIERGNVIIEFGSNMGVQTGDEYAILESRVLASGYTVADEIGLLIVKEVEPQISFAKIIYSDRRPVIGDQLEEIPRIGFDTGAYLHLISGLVDSGLYGTIGVRQSTSRGFFNFRPFVGVEVPFGITGDLGTSGVTVNLYGGAELNWYLRRLQLVPSAAAGVAGAVPEGEEESFSISHVGGQVLMTLSVLVSRDFKVVADVGYAAWFAPGNASTYSGALFGAGATYKY